MRFDHIDNFNQACASVAKLAAEAIAEHRRQIALIESIGREATALAERSMADLPRLDRKAMPLPAPEDANEAGRAARALPAGGPARPDERGLGASEEDADDILGLAMRRAEHESAYQIGNEDLPMFERTSANDFGAGSGRPSASTVSRDPDPDTGDTERGGGLVAALSGRKRSRRLASG
jgi:hypothetical protein